MSDEQSATSATEANALHAADVWLQRIGAPSDAVAVVTLWPRAQVGIWEPPDAAVRVLPALDDQAVELCEAVAQLVDKGARVLGRDAVLALALAARAGGDAGTKFQVLLCPENASALFRLVRGRQAVIVGGFALDPDEAHH